MYQSVIRDPGGTQTVRLLASTTIVNGSIILVPADTIAFFVCNGQVSEPYMPGRWTIRTGVSPFFVKFRNLMTQGDAGIICQVWYVNTCQENCKTGGTGDLVFQESRFRISMKARASYIIRYVIFNPLVFISKLIGMHHNSFDDEDIQPAIDAMLLPYIKHTIIGYISSHSIYSFQNDLVSIGNDIQRDLRVEFDNYGLSLRSVSITSVNIPDSEFKRLNELEEKYAKGTVATDIEVDNVKRVYGTVENRTLTEMLTGSVRGNATPLPRETNGVAGMVATLPLQMSIANQMVNQMSGSINNIMSTIPNAMSDVGSTNSTDNQTTPPDLPVRRRVCPECNRELDNADLFCRYCGNRL